MGRADRRRKGRLAVPTPAAGPADARAWLADDLFVDNHHLLRAGAAAFTDRLAGEVLHPWLCGHPTGGRP